jgi:catechol 2,3-dioxygenase
VKNIPPEPAGTPSTEKPGPALDARVSIGHVHLKVSDLERSVRFYTELLGLELTTRMGKSAAFLSAGGYHHHIGLNTWDSDGGPPPPPGSTGLYHFAILVPNRKELARSLKRLIDAGWPIDGAADHGVSEAIYLRDPDKNGIELYTDRPRNEWPRDSEGGLVMYTRPLDVARLLAELDT